MCLIGLRVWREDFWVSDQGFGGLGGACRLQSFLQLARIYFQQRGFRVRVYLY